MTKILNDFHYKAKIITEDQYFKDFVSFLLSKFDNLGCPIPDKGFKNDKEYEEWRKLYWQIVDKNKGKSLPPLFKIYIKELVVYYKIEEKYKKYFEDFFLNYIFFKKDYYPHPGFTISWKNNKRTNEHELYIRIFSHTTKENIIKNWSIVKNEKKLLNDWSKKNKNRKDFKRDLEIYKLYKKLKNVRRIRNNKGENIYRNKRLDEEISSIIMDKYEDLSWENIRKIITRMKKLDTEFVTNK